MRNRRKRASASCQTYPLERVVILLKPIEHLGVVDVGESEGLEELGARAILGKMARDHHFSC
jgi:hypothetical protein